MEEKLNSIIITIVFITGMLISLNIISKLYLILFLIFLVYLVYKCRLLIIIDYKYIFTIIFFFVVMLLGIFRGYFFSKDYSNDIKYEGAFAGEAQIISMEDNGEYVISLRKKPYCRVMLATKEKLKPGMIITLKGYLELPSSESNRGGFSYQNYLKYKGIKFIINSDNLKIIKQLKNLKFFLHQYQEGYINKLRKQLGNQTRFIESIFLGKVTSLSEEEITTWREMGILHLQAVSGSQVGAALDILLFLFVITPRKGIIKYTIIFTPLLLYGLMTDTPSVWRVILYLIIIKVLQIFKKEKCEMLALMLSSIILIIINPGFIFHISFQLSYIISIGLLLNSQKIKETKNPIFKLVISGFLSVILSWPILMVYFQEISLMTIFFTPLISPLIQMIIFISGIFMLFPFCIDLLRPLSFFLKLILILLDKITIFFSNFDLPVYKGSPWSLATIVLFYLIFIFWDNQIFKVYYRKILLVLFIILLFNNNFVNLVDNKRVIITFINVGQGDSILIECKEVEKVILIDGGAKNEYLDMGKREVLPYLKRKGIKKIDIMISTHSDNDHIGGLETILKEIPVKKIWIPNNGLKDYEDWLKIHKENIKIIDNNMKFSIGDITIDILNPDDKISDTDSNTASIVLNLEYGESSVLLTGDCDLDILDSLVKEKQAFDIIKAPHHGSIHSFRKGIYSELKAKSIIFSVGKNRYGHPSEEIITELEENNIVYYRTDQDKDVVITLKKFWTEINGRKFVD